MADVHSTETRSYNMSRIGAKDTKPEILVRKFLFSRGLRYRLHLKNLPGTPDLVFPKFNKVVFINGCFWHGHEECKYFVPPKTRVEWWLRKISATKQRDVENSLKLNNQGWKVISVWECSLKSDKRCETLAWLENEIRYG